MPVSKHRKKKGQDRPRYSRIRRKVFRIATSLDTDMLAEAAKQAADAKLPDRERGLYAKFQTRRIDGSTKRGGKHEKCDFFVLDLNHDPHAIPAIFSYATSARADGYELLAGNLFAKIQPYIEELNKKAQEAEDAAPEYSDVERSTIASLSDTELLHAVNMGAWVDLEQGAHHLQLEELMTRYEKLTSKPKRVRKQKNADSKATEKAA